MPSRRAWQRKGSPNLKFQRFLRTLQIRVAESSVESVDVTSPNLLASAVTLARRTPACPKLTLTRWKFASRALPNVRPCKKLRTFTVSKWCRNCWLRVWPRTKLRLGLKTWPKKTDRKSLKSRKIFSLKITFEWPNCYKKSNSTSII